MHADHLAIPDWLSRRAADTPGRPALIAGSLRWTWSDLERRAAALAADLAATGVGRGDRVCVLMANGAHYVEAVHALIRLRAVLVPINVRLAREEMAWQARHCGARLLIYDAATADRAEMLTRLLPGLQGHALVDPVVRSATSVAGATLAGADSDLIDPGARSVTLAAVAPAPAAATREELERIDLATVHGVIYTSGTSGRPKGVLITYGNHWWNAVGSALNLGLRDDDRWLACLPFFHVGGLSVIMRGVIYGIPVVLQDAPAGASTPAGSFDPMAVNRAIEERGATIVSVVGTMLSRMLSAMKDRDYPRSLRCVLLGGGPAPRPLLEECARRGIPVMQTYGLTETASQLATLAPPEALRKLGSAGRPLLPNELSIQPLAGDGEAHDQSPAATPVGEILVRGPSVTVGYLPDDGDLEMPVPATDAEGWLHTGDAGYLDDDGYLYVLDRRVDLIVSGGENVYPAEVEAVLHTYPAIAEAAVYGVADDEWGQRVAAAIVARPGARIGVEDVVAFCRERLAAYKVPSQIRLLDALPRNAAGKLLRRNLRGD